MVRMVVQALVAVAFGIAALGGAAQAQKFPSRPVTMIVPWPAGGSTDVLLRALAGATEKHLGQPIVIENRPGATGTLGPMKMANEAAPDGHTVAQIAITMFRVPVMTKIGFDPLKELTYIIALTGYTFGVVVREDAPWKTFADLLADAKANPGKINYGTPGAGSSLHISMEQIAKMQGIQWVHVPFKGNAESNNALLGGHIHVVADSTGWAPLVSSGKFRLLVTWGAARTRSWPDVPTLRESGIDLVSVSPFGLAGPKGMQPGVVKVLHDAFKAGLDEPAYTTVMTRLDQERFYLNSADYRAYAERTAADERRSIIDLGLAQN
jgi:tripartite-type tricarboxylate transporter receptor subunit TctC